MSKQHELYVQISDAFQEFVQGEPPDGEAFAELYDDLAALLLELKPYRGWVVGMQKTEDLKGPGPR